MRETQPPQKPIHSLILDTGPLIKNAVSISTMINSAEEIFTTSSIISEIRDGATRSRVQTTLMPFLKIRNPSPASYDAVIAFSKKTGDYAVLSRQDLGILALAYEIHCERNGGPWGLREAPKQPVKRKSGEEQKPKSKEAAKPTAASADVPQAPTDELESQQKERTAETTKQTHKFEDGTAETVEQTPSVDPIAESPYDTLPEQSQQESQSVENQIVEQLSEQQESHESFEKVPYKQEKPQSAPSQEAQETITEEGISAETTPATLSEDLSALNLLNDTPPSPPATDDSDSDGEWITPSNLSNRRAKDAGLDTNSRTSAPKQLDVATMTIDFAMQNVLLQMNLHLLSTNMQRIKHLSSKVLRCHACFMVVKQLDKQFCPRCGGASLNRVSCSTNANGEFKIHLARNYTHNKRGDKFSVPKPIAGTANGKWSGQGGGKGGWGRDLILAEDQKEYTKQMEQQRRAKKANDLMDDDYLPGILTGDRGRAGGRPKVGAGKNVNSKKRY